MPDLLARYEFKYLIQPEQADGIRAFVAPFLTPDEYGDAAGAYWVNSLYLDTWDWALARATVDGVKNRFKLRMRCYDFEDSPVFCEIKARVGTSILKTRALIARSEADGVARNSPSPQGTVVAWKRSHQADLDRFRNLVDRGDMRPQAWIRYHREAYVSPFGEGSRLTFDRSLQVAHPGDDLFHPRLSDFHPVILPRPTILEMKFNGAAPAWMRQLVRAFDLRRVSVAKYVEGARLLKRMPFNATVEHAWTAW